MAFSVHGSHMLEKIEISGISKYEVKMLPGCSCVTFRIPLINTVYELNLKIPDHAKW